MKKRKNQASTSVAAALGWSLLTSIAVTLLLAVIITFLTAGEYIQEQAMSNGAVFSALIAAIAGAIVIICRIQHKTLWICLAAAGIYFLCLLAMTAMFFGGQYANVGVMALAVFGGSSAAILLSLRGKGGTGKRKIKYRIR